MPLNIGDNIKRLRIQQGVTQRELADAFNVSHQAISKWESNDHLPDVELLPKIASYFGVAIDDLFYDKKVKRHQYEENVKERFFYYILHNQLDEAEALIDEARAKDPGNHFFIYAHIHLLTNKSRKEDMDELIRLSNIIFFECSDRFIVNEVTVNMIRYYSRIGMSDRALIMAENQTTVWRCSEYLACFATEGKDLEIRFGRMAYEFFRVFYITCVMLGDIEKPNEIIESHERIIGMIKAMVPSGNYSEFGGLLCKSYAICAVNHYKLGNTDKAYDCLQKSTERFIDFFSSSFHTFEGDIWFKWLGFKLTGSDNLVINYYSTAFDDVPEFKQEKRFQRMIENALSKAKKAGMLR